MKLNLFLLSTLSPSFPLDETNTIHLKCNVASSTDLFLLSTLSPSFPLDETNTIHLKCNVASSTESYSVLDHQVPVFICNKDALTSSEWDITTQQVNNLGIFPLYLTLSYNIS